MVGRQEGVETAQRREGLGRGQNGPYKAHRVVSPSRTRGTVHTGVLRG